MGPFPFPSTVADWLGWIFVRFQQDGAVQPGEPQINFLSPLKATDNPGNQSIDISLTAGILAFVPQVSSPTYQIAANTSVPLNTSANAVAAATPTTPTDGTRIQVYDAARAVETNPGTLTDASGLLIQNPLDLEFYATITWGPGSGGAANPNLPKGYCATWQRTTVTVASVSTTRWHWMQ